MSYESAIKLKHATEDSFKALLSYTSAMSERELELAAAKLADIVSAEQSQLDQQNGLLVGEVLNKLIGLRRAGQIRESKTRRAWYALRKGKFKREIAENKMSHIRAKHAQRLEDYNQNKQRVWEEYVAEVAEVQKQRKSLPLLERIFKSPPLPRPPLFGPAPELPRIGVVEFHYTRDMDIGDLLICKVIEHQFPHIEIAAEFATEENLRTLETALLSHTPKD